MEGDIIVQKTDIDNNSIISNNLSMSSGSRRWSYRTQTRKGCGKKCHGSKLRWWDDPDVQSVEDSKLPTHPLEIHSTDHLDKFNSQIRGVPVEVESKLQALIS